MFSLSPKGRMTMGTSLRVARRALAGLGKRGRTTAIPGEVREVLVACALEQRERGKSWAAIAEALGVSSSGLIRWSKRRIARCEGAVPVEVRVEAPSNGSSVTLVSPAGYRVEGLGVSEAVAMLRELG
jgi:transposase-like protein